MKIYNIALIFTIPLFCFPIQQQSKNKYSEINKIQETSFVGNYMAKGNKVFVYEKPNSKFKTTTKLPKNIFMLTSKKSGDFVYGEFELSTNKKIKGWFKLKDLKEIFFVPPVTKN